MRDKKQNQAIGIAFGALIGFVFGTFLKILYSIGILILVIDKLLNLF